MDTAAKEIQLIILLSAVVAAVTVGGLPIYASTDEEGDGGGKEEQHEEPEQEEEPEQQQEEEQNEEEGGEESETNAEDETLRNMDMMPPAPAPAPPVITCPGTTLTVMAEEDCPEPENPTPGITFLEEKRLCPDGKTIIESFDDCPEAPKPGPGEILCDDEWTVVKAAADCPSFDQQKKLCPDGVTIIESFDDCPGNSKDPCPGNKNIIISHPDCISFTCNDGITWVEDIDNCPQNKISIPPPPAWSGPTITQLDNENTPSIDDPNPVPLTQDNYNTYGYPLPEECTVEGLTPLQCPGKIIGQTPSPPECAGLSPLECLVLYWLGTTSNKNHY